MLATYPPSVATHSSLVLVAVLIEIFTYLHIIQHVVYVYIRVLQINGRVLRKKI